MAKVLVKRIVSLVRGQKMYAMGNAIAIGLRKGLVDAGVPVAYETELTGLVIEDGRVVGIRSRGATDRARIVVGADGWSSFVARAVDAPVYEDHGTLTCAFYTYWSGLALDGVQLYPRPGCCIVAAPTKSAPPPAR